MGQGIIGEGRNVCLFKMQLYVTELNEYRKRLVTKKNTEAKKVVLGIVNQLAK